MSRQAADRKTQGDPFVQTRSARGMIPVSAAEPVVGGMPCDASVMDALCFTPVPPTEAAATQHAAPSHEDMPLLQLASCIKRVPRQTDDGSIAIVNGVAASDVAAFAAGCGPLLAREPFARGADGATLSAAQPFEEPLGLWASAVTVANVAVSIQEFAAGHIAFGALADRLPYLMKRMVANPRTGESFSIFDIVLAADEAYAAWLGAPAFVRREAGEGRFVYSFLLAGDEDGLGGMDLVVASFDHEITALDYQLLSAACELPEAIDADVQARLELDGELNGGLGADILLGEDVPVEPEDLPVLQSMVRALVAVHMGDARVDLFSADEETGYLAFGSALSWMWYDFSRGLDIARIRYCAQCGKAFPLVGHRGPDKQFCSIECKNNARNGRVGQRRNKVRAAFREQGVSVAELARLHFPEDSRGIGERRVRECLSSWPALKHDIDDDIGAHGWNSPVLKRCRDEGLDLERLLPARRKAELRKLSGK